MTSRFRNVATLLILAKWALGNLVAPKQVLEVVMMIMMVTMIIMLMYMK